MNVETAKNKERNLHFRYKYKYKYKDALALALWIFNTNVVTHIHQKIFMELWLLLNEVYQRMMQLD